MKAIKLAYAENVQRIRKGSVRDELIARLTTVENNYQRGYRSSSQHYNDLARIRDDMYYNRYYIDHSDLYEALNNTLEELI